MSKITTTHLAGPPGAFGFEAMLITGSSNRGISKAYSEKVDDDK